MLALLMISEVVFIESLPHLRGAVFPFIPSLHLQTFVL